FSDLCEAMGIVFVGPSGDVMRALGDKIQSKLLAEKAGVPVAAWSNGPVESIEAAREHAERIGYPLMIKAAAGGGGRGIRRGDAAPQLAAALVGARAQALRAFWGRASVCERRRAGHAGVRRRRAADGAARLPRAQRRGAGDRRRPGRGLGG